MSNKKTSDELSGSPIEGADLFRIARGTDNYKLTSDEIFSETLTKLAATNKMAANELIVGRVYKITTPSTAFPAISSAYLTAIATNKFSPEATVIMVDGKAYEAYYDFALDTFGYVNVTHAVLRDLGMNKQLVPGMTYRITDYKSVNLVNGYNNFYDWGQISLLQYNNQETYVSPVEVLRIKAISDSQFELTASSESFPQDILEYDVYGNSICDYLNFSNGDTLPNSSTVSNFDLKWDPVNSKVYIDMPTGYPVEFNQELYIYWDAGSDFKEYIYYPCYPNVSVPIGLDTSNPRIYPSPNIKIVNNGTRIIFEGLTYTDYNNYDTDSLYIENTYKFADSYGHVTRRIDTKANIDLPLDFRNYKYNQYYAQVYSDSAQTNLLFEGYIYADNEAVDSSGNVPIGYDGIIVYDLTDTQLFSIFENIICSNIIHTRLSYFNTLVERIRSFDNVVFNNSLDAGQVYISNVTFEESWVTNITFISDSHGTIWNKVKFNNVSKTLFLESGGIVNTVFKNYIQRSIINEIISESELFNFNFCSILNQLQNSRLFSENGNDNKIQLTNAVFNLFSNSFIYNVDFNVSSGIIDSSTTKNIFRANNGVLYVSYFNSAGPAMVYSTTINC